MRFRPFRSDVVRLSVSSVLRHSTWLVASLVIIPTFGLFPTIASAQIELDAPPINYFTAPVNDPIANLQKRIDAGEATLEFDDRSGYLASLLDRLGISPSSQGLVYSKTSFQLKQISPRSPRAVYFGDDVYIGWVRGGDVVEISAVDPQLGAVFYTLDQRETEQPKFARRDHECLQCHSSTLTKGVPGHVVRSVYPAPDGQPILRAGSFITTHASPLEERWGGWYVTGEHGEQRHLGNLLVRGARTFEPNQVDRDPGANVVDLAGRFPVGDYLSKHSDIVALMVLEHQTQAHNLITMANYRSRLALRDHRVICEMLGDPADKLSPSIERRLDNACEPLLQYFLFADETELDEPVRGTSSYRSEFEALGPRDSEGRSLRQFDLEDRLFRYPLSYLIYSDAFDALPNTLLERFYRRLWDVLTERDDSDTFAHISRADRRAVLGILRATKDGLPEYWGARRAAEGSEPSATESERTDDADSAGENGGSPDAPARKVEL